MAARQIIVAGAMPSRDANGRNLPAKFRFYEPDTALTAPATVYTSSALATPHTFPILSDAAGRWPQIWSDEAETFDVAWSDQTHDRNIAIFTDVRPADDALLASADIAEAAADAAELALANAEAVLDLVRGLLDGTLQATSSTSLTIGLGAKSFTLNETGKRFEIGHDVVLASAGNRMAGNVTAFNATTGAMTVNFTAVELGAAGTFAAWSVAASTVALNVGSTAAWAFSGDITPAQITANANDYNPTGLSGAAVLRLSTDASRNITGLQGGADGRVVRIDNVGAFPIVLKNADAGSTAANRFAFGVDRTLEAGRSLWLSYDSTQARWLDTVPLSKLTQALARIGTDDERYATIKALYDAQVVVGLTDAATIAVDMSTFINGSVTLGGNRTLGNPTNPKVGQSGIIAFTQDGTGSRTLSFSSNWKKEGGAPTLTTTAGATDYIVYTVFSATLIIYSFMKAPS